ncbi:MAG TPA: hypothetical protein VGH64_09930 [Puia sp.]
MEKCRNYRNRRKYSVGPGNRLYITHRVGGLMSGWRNFKDSLNPVTGPHQMGSGWRYAKAAMADGTGF